MGFWELGIGPNPQYFCPIIFFLYKFPISLPLPVLLYTPEILCSMALYSLLENILSP